MKKTKLVKHVAARDTCQIPNRRDRPDKITVTIKVIITIKN